MNHYFNQSNFNISKSEDDLNTLESLVNDASIEDKNFDDVLFASAQLKDWKNFDKDKAWANVDRDVFGSNNISVLKYLSAAIVLIAISVAFYLFPTGDTMTFVASEQNKYIVLPDGSDVVLSPYSQLVVNSGFNDSNRDISLKGGGYFNVVKNKNLPFKIDLEKGNVEVLGTTFYVKQDNQQLDVKLVSGVLKVTDKNSKSEIINDNQEARVSSTIEIDSNLSFEETDLKFDDLVFKDITLGGAIQEINNIYNKEIIKIADDSDSLKQEMIYMTVKNSSAVNFLRGLKMIFSIEVANVKGCYVISNENVK